MGMILGFTGTRWGWTRAQGEAVAGLIVEKVWEVTKTLQGCCVGADHQFQEIIRALFDDKVETHGLPGPHLKSQWVCQHCTKDVDVLHPGKTHFARNRDIVDGSNIMIATPGEKVNPGRGGTWYTIGYARKVGKPLYIVHTDGSIE